MVTYLLLALLVVSSPLTLVGLLFAFHLAKSKKWPMDASNRINHIRLVWFALTRPDLFVDVFPWLRNDELDNVGQ